MCDFKKNVVESLKEIIDLGYVCTNSSEECITFESEAVTMLVCYDRHRSFELDVRFTLNKPTYQDRGYYLLDIYREANLPDYRRMSFCQSCEDKKLWDFLKRTSATLIKHAHAVLTGKQEAYDRLKLDQSTHARIYTMGINLSVHRPAAERAWREKQYSEYVRIMTPYKEVLKKSDLKKIDYAISKIN